MILPGCNNITNFGCFVDIGVKESGLVHISQLKSRLCKWRKRSSEVTARYCKSYWGRWG
jgi:transcriptional accessory protein Tex/SPT6